MSTQQPENAVRLGPAWPNRSTWSDVAVLGILCVIAMLGFAPAFGGEGHLLAGLGGLLVGTAVALAGTIYRLGLVLTIVIGVAAYFVFGSAFAMPGQALLGVIPTGRSLAGLAVGAVYSWTDIVTLRAPVGAPDYITVLPYVAGWFVALGSMLLVLRWLPRRRRTPWRSAVLLTGPVLLYLAGILTGTEDPYMAGFRGLTFATIALVWLAWRRGAMTAVDQSAAKQQLRGKLIGSAIVVVGALVLGMAGGALIAPPEPDRFVLREKVDPPFDPAEYPSPLSGFRSYLKEPVATTPLFRVSGLPAGQRVRLAVLDSFDGIVWKVADSDPARPGSGDFRLVGRALPALEERLLEERVEVQFEILGYADHWVPVVGRPARIEFSGEGASDLSGSLLHNEVTDTLAAERPLSEGLRYTISTLVSPLAVEHDDTLLADATLNTSISFRDVSPFVPASLELRREEYLVGLDFDYDRLLSIESALNAGFLSHGRDSDVTPSSAGHGSDRIEHLFALNHLIGDEEQFASAFALMARQIGVPARVVMGFKAPEGATGTSYTVTGEQVTAWVEVAFDDYGWVAFDPAPQNENPPPTSLVPKPQTVPEPQVRQPPRATGQEDQLLTAVEIEEEEQEEEAPGIPGWVFTVLLSIGIPLALYFIPVLFIAWLKLRRRRRRQGHGPGDHRIAAGWDELMDSYAELGYRVPRRKTRLAVARQLQQDIAEQLRERERDQARAARREEELAELRRSRAAAAEQSQATAAGGKRQIDVGSLIRKTSGSVAQLAALAASRGKVDQDVVLPGVPPLDVVARRADEAVFSGREIGQDWVDDYWTEVRTAANDADKTVSRFRRFLRRFRYHTQRDWDDLLTTRDKVLGSSGIGKLVRR